MTTDNAFLVEIALRIALFDDDPREMSEDERDMLWDYPHWISHDNWKGRAAAVLLDAIARRGAFKE